MLKVHNNEKQEREKSISYLNFVSIQLETYFL